MHRDNSELTAGFFIGVAVAFAIMLFAWSIHNHSMRKEAIKRNVASWVTDNNGVTRFEWNQIPEEEISK